MSKDKQSLSDDELIQLASQSIEPQKEKHIPQSTTDVERFISHYSMKPGTDKVGTGHIYLIYLKWGGRKESRAFFRIFKKYFKQVRTGKQRFYLINKYKFPPITPNLRIEISNFNKLWRLQRLQNKELSKKASEMIKNGDWKEVVLEPEIKLPENTKGKYGKKEKD